MDFSFWSTAIFFGMDDYPPGRYLRDALGTLPVPGPDASPRTVEIDARPEWGRYRVTFVAKRNSERAMGDYWYWAAKAGKRC